MEMRFASTHSQATVSSATVLHPTAGVAVVRLILKTAELDYGKLWR